MFYTECQAYYGVSVNEAHICILDLEESQSACNVMS